LGNEEKINQIFLASKNQVYMPIITNYFSEIDTGHKDFVRSMIHFKQKSPLKPDDIKLRDIPNTEENKNDTDESEEDSEILKEIKTNRKKKK
jgi:hypothetical protein